MHLFRKSLTVVLAVVSAAATSTYGQAPSREYEQLKQEWREYQDTEAYRLYSEEVSTAIESIEIQQIAKCLIIDGGPDSLLWRIDDHGAIEKIVPQFRSERAECWIRLFRNLQLPPPPYSPLVFSVRMS